MIALVAMDSIQEERLMAIQVIPATPTVGAELRGIDLASGPNDEAFREILAGPKRKLWSA